MWSRKRITTNKVLPAAQHFSPRPYTETSETRDTDAHDPGVQGFIRHPARCPVHIRKLGLWQRRQLGLPDQAQHHRHGGLIVRTSDPITPGTVLEIGIPTQQEEQSFTGRVVLMRGLSDGFEIGVWFLHEKEVKRIRMVEQICRIELYLHDKKHCDGPFVSRETLAQEWVDIFARRFPEPHTTHQSSCRIGH